MNLTLKYSLGIIFIFIGWQIIGGIPLVVSLLNTGNSLEFTVENLNNWRDQIGYNTFFIFQLIPFMVGLAFLIIWLKYVHKTVLPFITSRSKFNWRRFKFMSFVYGFLFLIAFLSFYFIYPTDYKLIFELKSFSLFFFLAILLIPIQVTFEELFIRGYLFKVFELISKHRIFPVLATSFIFTFLHLYNPEIEVLGKEFISFYLITGLFLGIIRQLDNGLELCIGFHFINNLLTILLISSRYSSIRGDSVFEIIEKPVFSMYELVFTCVIYIILYFILTKKYNWSFTSLFQKQAN